MAQSWTRYLADWERVKAFRQMEHKAADGKLVLYPRTRVQRAFALCVQSKAVEFGQEVVVK